MIIIKLKGGLGNQLFQYALGRALSSRTGMALKLDASSFRQDALRNYRLQHLCIEAGLADEREIEALNPSRARYAAWLARRCRWAVQAPYQRSCVKERGFPFDPEILKIRQPVYLNGYWQSEKYFDFLRSRLLEELLPAAPVSPENAALAAEMRACESVSLHIRRGDYVANPEALKVHGVVPLDYYRAAAAKMAAGLEKPRFFIFSDDMAWVRENLDVGHPLSFVGADRRNADYEDLYLMSQCRHQIIANSSFSWWGAWLNRNPDKIVLAPKQWFAAPIDTRDLLPEGWTRL